MLADSVKELIMNRFLVVAYTILCVLGTTVYPPLPEPLSRKFVIMLFCLALLSGFVEAAATVYTGKRRWIWAWLPVVAGVVGYFEVMVAIEVISSVGPPDPDGPYALVVFPFMAVGFAVPFALLVHGWATCLLWLGRARVWPKHSISC